MQLDSKGIIYFSLLSIYKAEILQGYPNRTKKNTHKKNSFLILSLPQNHTLRDNSSAMGWKKSPDRLRSAAEAGDEFSWQSRGGGSAELIHLEI